MLGPPGLVVCLGGKEKRLMNNQAVCTMIPQLIIFDYFKIPASVKLKYNTDYINAL